MAAVVAAAVVLTGCTGSPVDGRADAGFDIGRAMQGEAALGDTGAPSEGQAFTGNVGSGTATTLGGIPFDDLPDGHCVGYCSTGTGLTGTVGSGGVVNDEGR